MLNGETFLSAACTYAFLLNIDWFQPYERSTYSVGVIYLVLLNSPRSLRYKRENIVLVSVIPGPTEPSLLINTYLKPLVLDFLKLWDGLEIQVQISPSNCLQTMKVHAALIGVSCDIPAGRKVCGFLSHSAKLGCTRCYCETVRETNEIYFKFKRDQWVMRTGACHRTDVAKLAKCTSKTEKNKMELQLGCRYSVLLKLPYFDPVRMLLIDPMHNLFLGSAKYVVKSILIGKGFLTAANLDLIHERMKRIRLHMDIGRLPVRLDSGTTFTAEQWMNWTIYYSILCLRGLLPSEHMECWRHFVFACRRLELSTDDVTIADCLLLNICKCVSHLYGRHSVTPNMHLHTHLASCVKDFGPCHTFWLFSFERYNGILGNQPTNNRSIEVQLMSRFMKDYMHLDLLNRLQSSSAPFNEFFSDSVVQHARNFSTVGSQASCDKGFSDPPKHTLTVLPIERISVLKSSFSLLYPDIVDSLRTTLMPATAR